MLCCVVLCCVVLCCVVLCCVVKNYFIYTCYSYHQLNYAKSVRSLMFATILPQDSFVNLKSFREMLLDAFKCNFYLQTGQHVAKELKDAQSCSSSVVAKTSTFLYMLHNQRYEYILN